MSRWFEILRKGDYPQGNITDEIIASVSQFYDPNHLQAPVTNNHRQFNEKGELINNEPALGWIKAVKGEDGVLYAMFEDEDELKWIFDGKRYRYASVEIQQEKINGKKVPYLAALAVTNFPASRIKQIFLTDEKQLSVYTIAINKNSKTHINTEEVTMDLTKLNQLLELPGETPADKTLEKITGMKDELKANLKYTEIADKVSQALTIVSAGGNNSEAITQLTTEVASLKQMIETSVADRTNSEFHAAVSAMKILPSQHAELVGSAEQPGAFFNNPEGLKSFAAKLPELKINTSIIVPKNDKGNPLTYNDLLDNPVKFVEMQKNNPALLQQLRANR